MESYMTYVNKGSVIIDLDKCTKLKDLTNEEIAEELGQGNYVTDGTGVYPTDFAELSDEIKEDFEGEEDYKEYISDMMSMWDYHNESELDFDKIKNEEHYFLVQ